MTAGLLEVVESQVVEIPEDECCRYVPHSLVPHRADFAAHCIGCNRVCTMVCRDTPREPFSEACMHLACKLCGALGVDWRLL